MLQPYCRFRCTEGLSVMPRFEWHILDNSGQRKYVAAPEMMRFIDVAKRLPEPQALFCLFLAATGCRVSEAAFLMRSNVHPGRATVRTLKRRKLVYRELQLPFFLSARLMALPPCPAQPERVWNIHRATGWRWVKRAMRQSGISGTPACPKGLRHGFGIRAASARTPAGLIQALAWSMPPLTRQRFISMPLTMKSERSQADAGP
jgi:integrase/recombinase XerD